MRNQVYLFGEFRDKSNFSRELFATLFQDQPDKLGYREIQLQEIFGILERLSNKWRDSEYIHRKKILEVLLSQGTSLKAAQRDLDTVAGILDPKSLQTRLQYSIPYSMNVLDQWIQPGPGLWVRAIGLGVLVHICAGNVFLGALDSLLMGLVTKNINILKLSSADPESLLYFADSLLEEDPEGILAQRIALVHWSREEKAFEEIVLSKADGIMIWGGDEVIQEYKQHAHPRVKVMGYGPKISFAVIGAQAFQESQFQDLAKGLAHDICMYDQKACACPQNIFIPTNNPKQIQAFLKILGQSMEQELVHSPASAMSEDELAELLRHRELRKFDASQNWAIVEASSQTNGYTFVFADRPGLEASPLNRFVYLKPFANVEDLSKQIAGMKYYLQTVGLAASPSERTELKQCLFRLGVTRITELGKMLDVRDGAPHDGDVPIFHLLRWISRETPFLQESQPNLKEFLQYIYAHSQFYSQFWANVDWHAADFFQQIPLLTKEALYDHSPPDSDSIFTQARPQGALIFSSGGSTGRPKYSYFTNAEFQLIAELLAYEYKLSKLCSNDIAANLFVAGHLWSSFLVIDRALNHLGVTNLPIGGHLEIAEIVQYLKAFRPNVLFGLPSTLVGVFHYAQEHEIPLSIEKIFYAGEHIPPAMITKFQKEWGVQVVQSAGYASVDAGIIGYQCPHQQAGIHHLFSEHIHLELIDSDGHVIQNPKIEGEIVVTALYRKLMPIVRYRTGDLGYWIQEPCACGSRDPVFCLIGRCDNRLQIGGSRIFVTEIDRLLPKHEFLTGIYQFVPQYKDGEECLDVFLEVNQLQDISQAQVERFHQDFYEIFQDLRSSINQGWLQEPGIHFVAENTIPRVARTKKVKIIDDLRRK